MIQRCASSLITGLALEDRALPRRRAAYKDHRETVEQWV